MENASKALIIAGAILISIVLIAIGVMIVNSANNVVNQASDTMSDQDIQIFNAKFESYAGRKKGNQVKSLISAIRSNNATADKSGGQTVELVEGSIVTTKTVDGDSNVPAQYDLTKVFDNKYYEITFSYDTNGCINTVEIKEATN